VFPCPVPALAFGPAGPLELPPGAPDGCAEVRPPPAIPGEPARPFWPVTVAEGLAAFPTEGLAAAGPPAADGALGAELPLIGWPPDWSDASDETLTVKGP